MLANGFLLYIQLEASLQWQIDVPINLKPLQYVHTYIHPYIHTYIHTYMHTYIHTYIHT